MTALTDEQIGEAVTAYEAYGRSIRQAAQSLGLARSTFRERLIRAAERGLCGYDPILPGFRISQITSTPKGDFIQQKPERGPEFDMPSGQALKGVSALVYPDGRIIQQWIKTREDSSAIDWIETLKSAFADYEGKAPAIEPPKSVDEDYLNLIPCNDWHINLLTWGREVGENWDLKIAERVIGESIETAIARTRSAGTAVVLGGGDLMHNDDNTNKTARSGNLLDADGRHQKGIEVAQRLKVRTIEAALRHNREVIVRILKGNHDEQSSVAIAHFLFAWFHNEPRVTVDMDASLYWFKEFGSVMLAATHGHTVKISEMPSIMAHRRAEMWGRTKFRYAHGFHVHHKSKLATEGEGVICETHQAPVPQDSWHHGAGYLSGRSVQTITYHRLFGEVGRAREAIIDNSARQAS